MNNKAGYTLGHGCLLLLGPCAFFQFKNEEKTAAKVGIQNHHQNPGISQRLSTFKTSAISDIQNTYLVGPWCSTE